MLLLLLWQMVMVVLVLRRRLLSTLVMWWLFQLLLRLFDMLMYLIMPVELLGWPVYMIRSVQFSVLLRPVYPGMEN